MGIINRGLCVVFSLAVLIIAVVLLLAALRILPEDMFVNELRFLLRQEETPAVVGGLGLFALYFLLLGFFSGGSTPKGVKEISLVKSDGGEVKVMVEAVRRLVERTATEIDKVRETKADIKTDGNGIPQVRLDVVMLADANAPTVANEVVAKVKSELSTALSMKDVPVTVSVSEISNANAAKRVF